MQVGVAVDSVQHFKCVRDTIDQIGLNDTAVWSKLSPVLVPVYYERVLV